LLSARKLLAQIGADPKMALKSLFVNEKIIIMRIDDEGICFPFEQAAQ